MAWSGNSRGSLDWETLELIKPDVKFEGISLLHNSTPDINATTQYPLPLKMDIRRSFHTQNDIQSLYGKSESSMSVKKRIQNACRCSGKRIADMFLSYLPIINVLRFYKLREYIIGDALSGVSAACLHFPQGLAFGILASLAPEYGLYTSFFPVILYMIFGTSPHVSFGTNAVIALFTAEMVNNRIQTYTPKADSIETITNNISTGIFNNSSVIDFDQEKEILMMKVMTASGATFLVGIILLAMGLLRLGFITSYMSSSFIHAFVCASAFHIASSQLPKALGISIPPVAGAGKLVVMYVNIFKAIATTNIASLIITIISIIILVLIKDCVNERFKDRMKMPVPIDLLLVVVVTLISHFAKFKENFNVGIVGNIPSGIPTPMVPDLSESGGYIGTSVIVAVLVFVLTIAMARTCELKHDYQIDDNQELIAYGISNFGSSFFHCFPSCTAPPRTMILSAMGAKTMLNGLFTVVVMLLVLLVLGQLFTSLPLPALSAMVIVAVKDLLMHVKELPNFWRTNRYDFTIWVGTCACGILIDIPYALYAGIILGFFTVILQSQLSKSYRLGKLQTEDIMLNTAIYDDLEEFSNVKVFRMEYSLYFATAAQFKTQIFTEIGDPREMVCKIQKKNNRITEDKDIQNTPGDEKISLSENIGDDPVNDDSDVIKYVIIDCSAVTYVDMNGMRTLSQIVQSYKKKNVVVLLARCNNCLLRSLKMTILSDVITVNHVFPDIFDALYAIRKSMV